MFFILNILTKYIYSKLKSHVLFNNQENDFNIHTAKILNLAEKIYTFFDFCNFIVFMSEKKYFNLIDRILNI